MQCRQRHHLHALPHEHTGPTLAMRASLHRRPLRYTGDRACTVVSVQALQRGSVQALTEAGLYARVQISRAILNEQQKIQIPDWFDNQEEKPQVTKADLEEKIAKLHAAINDVATQVGPESKQKNANSAVASPVAK